MKKFKNKTTKSVGKMLGGALFLMGLLTFSSYNSTACSASYTYTAVANGHYNFTGTVVGAGPGAQYYWNPGDGSGWHHASLTFAYTYTANATYYASFLVTDTTCTDSIAHAITVTNVNNPCILHARFTYTVGAHGVVNFTSTSSGVNANTYYYWSPGDSNQRRHAGSTFTHKYLYQGTYLVWLTIRDTSNPYCIDSVSEYVTVNTADSSHCHVHANFTYTSGPNGQITFTNTSTGLGPIEYYLWILGDTTNNYPGKGPFSHTYAFNGTYSVTLTIHSDTSGCADSITLPVTVTNACDLEAKFTYAYDSNGQVKFTSTSLGVNGGTFYKWTFGDGIPKVTAHDTITHVFPFLGSYYVTLLDSNASGCTSSYTERINIHNRDSLEACFTYIADSMHAGQYDFSAACSKGTYMYTYYKWTPGDGDPSDSGLGMTTYNHTYLHNGPYSATLTEWYTIQPHAPSGVSPRYNLSTFTGIVNVSTVTGIASITDKGMYTIYPNPNDGLFRIAINGLANDKSAQIRVSNMMGQLIYQANVELNGGNTLSDINLQNAQNGIYMLQVITSGNTYVSRIAIQR